MKKTDIDRRQFFKSGAIAIGSLAIVGTGSYYLKSNKKNNIPDTNILRPPGSVAENIFVSECIKCGLCVQICPIQAIKLADIDTGLDYGTPYIDIREQACDFSCDSLQCVETCPTAVLDFEQFKVKGEESIAKYDEEMKGKQMDKNYNPFSLKRSAGAGLRIFMPAFGLLGIDFGYGFDPVLGGFQKNGWETHFIIGQQF